MHQSRVFIFCSFLIFLSFSCQRTTHDAGDWYTAGGNEGQTKFSALTQINKENVHQLKQAWVYHSGNTAGNIQCNPLVIKGVMYVTTAEQHLVAVDGTNGKEIWRFNPERNGEKFSNVNRGLAYYDAGDAAYLYYSSGNYLNAVNASTGEALWSFGDSGRIHMSEGLHKPADEINLKALAAPVMYKDIVIVGGTSWSATSNVSGFDALTGKRRWIFNTVAHPGEEGYETWGDTTYYRTGAGVNVWGGLCVDVERGMVFFSTGQPKPDFYRPNNPGNQLYGNSVVALDAATGKKKWHYQTIHKDLWDLDLPCAPILVTLNKDGKKIPGVAQLSKTGNVFLFDRVTGEPLSEIEERAVPTSQLEGETTSPTQPYLKWPEPYARQVVTAEDIHGLDSVQYQKAKAIYDRSDAGWFLPPSTKGLLYYGIHGGSEWGGASYDEKSNTLFINANELAWNIVMKDVHAAIQSHPDAVVYLANSCGNCHGIDLKGSGNGPELQGLAKRYNTSQIKNIIKNGKGAMPSFAALKNTDLDALVNYLTNTGEDGKTGIPANTPRYQSVGFVKFLDDNGYPATRPPWGTLNAMDLTTGKIKWKVPLGEYPELTAKGIPVTGTENFGGSIVTQSGLLFIAATRDGKMRAFDTDNGKILWEDSLPFGGYATPATYMVNGKQYVVIAATGGGKLATTTGDAYVAFALE